MKKLYAWAKRTLASPTLRPYEVWAFRVAAGYVAAKLGIDLAHAA